MASKYNLSTNETQSQEPSRNESNKETNEISLDEYEKTIEQIYQNEIENLGTKDEGVKREQKNLKLAEEILKKKKGKVVSDFGKVQFHNPVCICVSEGHRTIFVSEKGASIITMLDLNGEYKDKFKSNELKSPWGMAIKDDTIYVTDIEVRAVLTFSITQHALKDGLTSQPNFIQPRQLAINCANEVWVADEEGKEVVILNKELELIDKISNEKIQSPMDIKFTYAQAYILSRGDNNLISIHILEQNTREYLKLILQSNIDNPINSYFFQIKFNVILLPDSHSKSILVYSLSGEKITTLARERAMALSLDVLGDDIFILYKLDSAPLKKL